MKKGSLSFVFMLLLVSVAFGQVVNSFDVASADTNYWMYFPLTGGHYFRNEHATADSGYLILSYVPGQIDNGMQIEYACHNKESWGGFTKLEHWNPDSNAVYDWSPYDSISFWYNNLVACSIPTRIHFRLNLHDVSNSVNGNKTYNTVQTEFYYSFFYILDNPPGWNKITLPLINNYSSDGHGFNLTGWNGIPGNLILDKDKIKGFSIEFSISGGGSGDGAKGTVIFDHLELTGLRAIPLIVFFGKQVPGRLSSFTWGQSSLMVEEGTGLEGNNALNWVQGDGWTGAGFNINPKVNLAGAWSTDSLKFLMKTESGVGDLRMQFEGGTGKVGQVFTPIADGEWHSYALKLNEFAYKDGTTGFDSSAVGVFQFMAEGTGVAGKTILFYNMWTGNPVIDITPPPPPQNVSAATDVYYNVVTWEDTPNESGETYTVYASLKPFTDLTSADVDLVQMNVVENTQSATHRLYYPLEDKSLAYYYAATCKDANGNVSTTFTATPGPVTNTAKGVATISLTPPTNFVADGDVTEWAAIQPFELSPLNAHVPVGSVSDATDLSAEVYLAIDDDYLYVAIDVSDDVYFYGTGNWYDQDAFQLFIGLYDWRGPKHAAILRGEKPDYILYMTENKLQLDNPTGTQIFANNTENYFFEGQTPFYVAEAKIPLDTLAKRGKDPRFHPLRGMRIPIDLYFHDNDGTGWQGNLGFSPASTDKQWQNPGEWAHTWIGDTTDVVGISPADNGGRVATKYSLSQNYPNPFNPTTTIEYSIARPEFVRINIYNLMGQKVAAMVNEEQTAGNYKITWNARNVPSGIYFYRIKAGDFSQTRKMFLMK